MSQITSEQIKRLLCLESEGLGEELEKFLCRGGIAGGRLPTWQTVMIGQSHLTKERKNHLKKQHPYFFDLLLQYLSSPSETAMIELVKLKPVQLDFKEEPYAREFFAEASLIGLDLCTPEVCAGIFAYQKHWKNGRNDLHVAMDFITSEPEGFCVFTVCRPLAAVGTSSSSRCSLGLHSEWLFVRRKLNG